MSREGQSSSAAGLHHLLTTAEPPSGPMASQLQHIIYGTRSRPCDTELQQTSVFSLIQTQGFLSSTATLKLFAGKCSHTDYAATYRLHGLESPQPEERNVSEHVACVGTHSPGAVSPSRDASSRITAQLSGRGSTCLHVRELLGGVRRPGEQQLFSESASVLFTVTCLLQIMLKIGLRFSLNPWLDYK